MFRLVIPGEAVAKARARTVNGHSYTPAKTANYETYVRYLAASQTPKCIEYEPVVVTVLIERPYPRGWSKRKKAASRYPTTKPDLDNQAKAILDALNGIVYRDDSQIVELRLSRVWSESEQTTVEVAAL